MCKKRSDMAGVGGVKSRVVCKSERKLLDASVQSQARISRGKLPKESLLSPPAIMMSL